MHGVAVHGTVTTRMAWVVCMGLRWMMITAFKMSVEQIGSIAWDFVVMVGCVMVVPVFVLSRVALMVREKAHVRR